MSVKVVCSSFVVAVDFAVQHTQSLGDSWILPAPASQNYCKVSKLEETPEDMYRQSTNNHIIKS